MSSRAVVILTEPERCELVGPNLLMEAVLQIQQLNKAGVATSQTFCDQPAAAMTFIDAYAKAFPELHMRAVDLPLPEQLYSLVASGRILPLSPSTAPEAAKPGEASQLYPLYVLSLGAPDALLRALKHSSIANSDIKVIEIAPLERPSTEAVSVAETVTHDDRRSGPAADHEHDQDDGFGSAEWASRNPLNLESVEVDLDHIQSDRSNGPGYEYDQVLDERVPAATSATGEPTPSSTTTGETGAGPPVATGEANAGGGAPAGALTPAAPDGGTPQGEPAGGRFVAGEAGVPPETSDTAPPAHAGSDADPGAEADSSLSGEADAQDDSAVAETDAGVGDGNVHDDASGRAGDSGEECTGSDAEATSAGSSETGSSGSSTTTSNGSSFHAPGGDVSYPANGSFVTNDDVTYPLPAGSGPGELGARFDGAADGEIDLAALFSGLSDPPGASTEAPDDLELRMLGARAALAPDSDSAGSSNPPPDDPVAPCADSPATDHDNAGREPMPISHDLDI